MAMKLKDVIKVLSKKDQNQEVEGIISTVEGQLVFMEIEKSAEDMAKVLNLFAKK
jgi:hypothetical protein